MTAAGRSGGRFRLAGQRAAGQGQPRPAGGLGERAGGRRRVPARAREGPADLLQPVPARRPPWQLGTEQRLRAQPDQQAGRAGLRHPLHPRWQAERAGADLPADPGHQGAAGAGPVLRPAQAHR
ncbi:hypothetical protein G6F24_016639 [Rhizopus arrhizus]|nr:hypothetical protein G6F24_016639 [Rhizopus arrhizus]